MSERPEIAVLCMGGTIAMTGERGAGVLPRLDAEALLSAVPALDDVARLRGRSISALPGPHVGFDTLAMVAQAVVQEIESGADGVVLTQGTDTLEESAFALDLMLDTETPVAMTGAMRNPALPGADGPANLLAAVSVAASIQARQRGVMVVMDDQIHAARFLRKVHTSRVGAFQSRPVLLGEMTESHPGFFVDLPVLPRIGLLSEGETVAVALLSAAMGEDGRFIDGLAAAGYGGAVVAGMGGGHVFPAMAGRLEKLATRMPVVVANRTGGGATLARTYAYEGGEMDLARRGLVRAGWLTPAKARVALFLLLRAGADESRIRSFFAAFGGG